MRRRLLYKPDGGGIPPSESSPCDICFYDKVNDNVIIVSGSEWSSDLYPSSRYTPIGVVVVPGSHNVYGDGSCGVMSLKEMNCDSPDSGSTSYQYICWGGWGDESPLPNLEKVPIGNTSDGIPTTTNFDGYLPSDKFSDTQCAHDTDAYYSKSSLNIPSPYLTDGSRNPGYYQTFSYENSLADFDGIRNSQVLWDLSTLYSDWQTASSIINDNSSGSYPAACCCWRYHTEGTQQGDWYLPACGELGYIIPPFNKINEAISNMRQAYGSSVGVELKSTYCSSTVFSSTDVRIVYTSNGNVSYYYKYNNFYVRAWLRVGGN